MEDATKLGEIADIIADTMDDTLVQVNESDCYETWVPAAEYAIGEIRKVLNA
jgi:hypothetical protein